MHFGMCKNLIHNVKKKLNPGQIEMDVPAALDLWLQQLTD